MKQFYLDVVCKNQLLERKSFKIYKIGYSDKKEIDDQRRYRKNFRADLLSKIILMNIKESFKRHF